MTDTSAYLWSLNLFRYIPLEAIIAIALLTALIPFLDKFKYKWYLLLLFPVLCVAFRQQLFFLGDGFLWTRTILYIRNYESIIITMYKNEPLAGFFLYTVFKMFQGGIIYDAVLNSYLIVDVVFGIGSIYVFYRLAKLYNNDTFLSVLAFLSLATTQIFFGYVENYAPSIFFFLVFVYVSVLHQRKLLAITFVFLSYTVLLFCSLNYACLLPVIIYFIVKEKKYSDTFIGLGISIVLAFVIMRLTAKNPLEYFQIFFSSSKHFELNFSFNHIVDYLNLLLFISPFPFVFWVKKKDPLLLAIAGILIVYGFIVISELGINRDWDLFSLYALGLSLFIILNLKKRLLLWFTVISFFHTSSWIYLNSREDLSLQYAYSLPSEFWDETDITNFYDEIASYHYKNYKYEEALKFRELSLQHDTTNARKWFNVGNGYYNLGDYQKAKYAYEQAIAKGMNQKLVLVNLDSINRKIISSKPIRSPNSQ